MLVRLQSQDSGYDEVYLRNYPSLQVKDVWAWIPDTGNVWVFGSGDYAMRIGLDI